VASIGLGVTMATDILAISLMVATAYGTTA
jgi:hypothetical protein